MNKTINILAFRQPGTVDDPLTDIVLSENSIRPSTRILGQNHRMIDSDVCDPARARNVRRRPVQVV